MCVGEGEEDSDVPDNPISELDQTGASLEQQFWVQLRGVLDDWGQQHREVLLQDLKSTLAPHLEGRSQFDVTDGWKKGLVLEDLQSKPGKWEMRNMSTGRRGCSKDSAPDRRGKTKDSCASGISEHERLRKIIFGPKGLKSFSRAAPENQEMLVMRKYAARLVGNQRFQLLCALAVAASALFTGWMSDHNMHHIGESPPRWESGVELCFITFFTVEVALRLLAQGMEFFCPLSSWNMFDLFLAAHGIFEAISHIVHGVGTASSFLCILRLFKIVRILRILRFLEGVHELRLITNSIMGGASAMLWSMILQLGVTYLFGVVFLQATAHFLQSNSIPKEEEEVLRQYWGSLRASMLTLFMATTGGEDWSCVAEPLFSVGWGMYLLFLLYVAFFLFAVTNAITSLFVEATMRRAGKDNKLTVHHELEKKDKYIQSLAELFHELDSDMDGKISFQDFQKSLDDPETQAVMSSLGINAYDVPHFFRSLSKDVRKSVDIETFVIGCFKHGCEAKSTDMFDLIQQQRRLTEEVRSHMVTIEHMARGLMQAQPVHIPL